MKNYIYLFISILFCFSVVLVQAQVKTNTDRKKKTRKETSIQQSQTVTPQTKPVHTTNDQVIVQSSEQVAKDLSSELDQILQVANPVIQYKPNGLINWTDQYIESKGMSVIDYQRFPNQAQARAMAIRGATVEAQRNLLEIVQGVNVVSETKVKDMMINSDYIYTRIEGIIKGAQPFGEPIEKDGIIEIRLRMPLYEQNGLASAVYNEASQLPILQQRAFGIDAHTTSENVANLNGLVFMMNGKQIDPALFPIIVDQNGRILLDMTKVYDPKSGKFPKILSSSKEILQELNLKKGVEFVEIIESYNGKLVVDPKSVKKINWEKIQKGLATAGRVLQFILTIL